MRGSTDTGNDVRGLLVLRPCQFLSGVDTEAHIWVRSASTDLGSLQAACGVDRDLQNADGRINRSSREKLLKIKGED